MVTVVECLTGDEPLDERMLVKAAAHGRVRDTVERVVAMALSEPRTADGAIRRELREARYLHSRERRVVADAIADLVRWLPVLSAAASQPGDVTAAWLEWLALRGGDPQDLRSPDELAAWLPEHVKAMSPLDAAMFLAHVGPDLAAALIESVDISSFLVASAQRATVTLRANRLKGSREELYRRLAMDDIETIATDEAPDGLVVQGRPNLRGHRLHRDGWFEVQDEASQCLVEYVNGDGEVVDWCAGAGGKTLAIASRFPGVPILALDVRAISLQELSKRAARAGVTVRTALHGRKSLRALEALGDGAATVVVDAPCTGSGVWRRHPAYRLGIDAARLSELAVTQAQTLRAAASSVRMGGRLIYATCSVLRCENEAIVEAFEADDSRFKLVEQRRWPVGPTDGFFVAAFDRVA